MYKFLTFLRSDQFVVAFLLLIANETNCRGSAFPARAIGGEDKCLWDEKKRLAICGDFCVSPNVEGAMLSGMRAASKFLRN